MYFVFAVGCWTLDSAQREQSGKRGHALGNLMTEHGGCAQQQWSNEQRKR